MSTPFQYLNLTFEDANGSVTNVTQPVASNVLNSTIYNTLGLSSLTFFGTVDVNTPSAAVMASASAVTSSGGSILFTKTDHGFYTGLEVQFTTSVTLPTGISALTDYYVIRVSSSTFKVATSPANALAGTAVAYTDTGTGNQTATPVALASASIYLQGSVDYGIASSPSWATVPNSTYTITADGSFVFELDNIRFSSYRAYATLASGMMAFSPLQIAYKGGGA